MQEDPRIRQARELLWEVTKEQLQSKKSDEDKSECQCGHIRSEHSVSHSINYTGGMCRKCKCLNFL